MTDADSPSRHRRASNESAARVHNVEGAIAVMVTRSIAARNGEPVDKSALSDHEIVI